MSSIVPQNQAAFWDPDNGGNEGDVIAHTPDPTRYHQPDFRQGTRMRSGVKGTVIPRATTHGGSLGFDATKPGIVHVDPEAPDGGAIVDLQQINAQMVNKSYQMSRHPHEAFYAMARKGQQTMQPPQPVPQPVQQHPAASAVMPAQEEPEMVTIQPPSISGAPTNVPTNPGIATLQPVETQPAPAQSTFAPEPQAPPVQQPVYNPPAPAAQDNSGVIVQEMFNMLMSRMDSIEKSAAAPAPAPVQQHVTAPDGMSVPLPPVQHPQAQAPQPESPPPSPNRVEQAPTTPGTEQSDPWGLAMPWISGPEPQRPQYQVIFKMPLGTISSYYHEVIQNGINLVLVFDNRFEATQQFMPPQNPDATFVVEIPSMKEKYTCSFGGQAFPVGRQDLMILIIHPPEVPQGIPGPPAALDISLLQNAAALDNMPHAGMQQAIDSGMM